MRHLLFRREILELKDTILLKENIIKDQAETLITIKKENERNSGHVKRLRNDIDIKCAEINRYKYNCECYAASLQKAQQEASVLTEEFRKATAKTVESITQVKRMSVELESQSAQKQALLQDIAVGIEKIYVIGQRLFVSIKGTNDVLCENIAEVNLCVLQGSTNFLKNS